MGGGGGGGGPDPELLALQKANLAREQKRADELESKEEARKRAAAGRRRGRQSLAFAGLEEGSSQVADKLGGAAAA